MKSQLRPALVVFGALTLVTGVAYPLLVTLLGQGLFPHRANGSLIRNRHGEPVGSELIGQPFDAPHYFWARPSATSPFPDNPASSSGSNLGPTNPDGLKAVADRVETLRKAHPDQAGRVPADLVTASASGLDPHISPAAAEYQVARVAAARGVTPEEVRELVAAHTEQRTVGILGEPRVNVLLLNRELDEKFPAPPETKAPVNELEAKAPEKAPDNTAARVRLARSLADRGDETAIADLRKLADAEPRSAELRTALADVLLQFGQFRPAAAAYREAADLHPPGSPEQAAAQAAARTATRWAGLERRLPEIVAGVVTPTTPAAAGDYAEVCRRTGHYAAAARLFAAAVEADAKLARPAAVCAALAGFNRGKDAGDLTLDRRAELRQSALAAFRKSPDWAADPALAPLKEPAALAALPAEEQAAWQAVWPAEGPR